MLFSVRYSFAGTFILQGAVKAFNVSVIIRPAETAMSRRDAMLS